MCVCVGGEGVEVLKCFVRGGSEFFLLALCVCVWGGGEVQFLSFREKNNRLPSN